MIGPRPFIVPDGLGGPAYPPGHKSYKQQEQDNHSSYYQRLHEWSRKLYLSARYPQYGSQ